ncbi:MAG: NAD-dependent epimerase/dehydratase family protein [Limisphaerales bacterium]
MSANPLSADLDHIVEQLRPVADELRGARLFITGGTGFIGCWMLESLAWANDRLGLGAQALVLTRSFDAFQKKAPHLASRGDICFHLGDVRDFAFPDGQFSHVIHAATDSNAKLNEQDPVSMLDTIVAGTARALDFTARRGAGKFLLTSSGAVYGRQPPDLIQVSEEYLGGPDISLAQSAYAEGKRLSEIACLLRGARDGIQIKIARCFAFVGPYLPLDIHFAVGNFIRDALAGGPIIVRGDGRPFRSYLYAADLAIWLWHILLQGKDRRAYNVGSGRPLTIVETAAAVSRVLPGNVPVSIAKTPVPGQAPQRYVPDISRAQQELGLREWIGLDDGILRTARWHQR